jgi:hypothetical protein
MVMGAFDLLEDGKPGLVIWNTWCHTVSGAKKYIRQRTNNSNSNLIAACETKIVEKYKDYNDLLRYFLGVRITQTYKDSLTTNKEQKAINTAVRNNRASNGRSILGTLSKHIKKAR